MVKEIAEIHSPINKSMVRKILVLTANPNDTNRLRADREVQGIQERLRRINQRSQFEIIFKCARPDTLLDVIEDEKPEIVHFCGHGTELGLVLENESGNDSHLVRTHALKMLFKRVSKDVQCVLLNACYSEVHAKAISEYIPYAIGMEGAIWDKAAIAFAGAFYRDLGDGKSIESAFERGHLAAHLINPDEDPKLFKRDSPTFLFRIWQKVQNISSTVTTFLSKHLRRQISLQLLGLICVGVAIAFGFPWLGQLIIEPNPQAQIATRLIDVQNVPSGLFYYGGSTTWAPVQRKDSPIAIAIREAFPMFQLEYKSAPANVAPSSATGKDMLRRGEITFAQASRQLSEQEQNNQDSDYKNIKVAKSFKAVAVHPSLNIPKGGLTLNDIDNICKGIVTNWQQVGGDNLPITVFSRSVNAGSARPVTTIGDECTASRMETDPIPQNLIKKLADKEGGFYVNAAAIVVSQCTIKTLPILNESQELVAPYQEPFVAAKQCESQPNRINVEAFKNGSYPAELGNELYVIVKQNNRVEQQAGEAYANLLLSDEGQRLLEETGYVSIR